jgi:hypothetical protein
MPLAALDVLTNFLGTEDDFEDVDESGEEA